jgi:hypothetical protein
MDSVGRCIGALAMSGVTQERFEGKALEKIVHLAKNGSGKRSTALSAIPTA